MLSIVTCGSILALLQMYWWIDALLALGVVAYLAYRVADWLQVEFVKNAPQPSDLEQLTAEIYRDKRERKRERSAKMLWKGSFSWILQVGYALVGIPVCVYLLQSKLSYGSIYLVLIGFSFLLNMLLSKMFTLWTPSRPFACRDFHGDRVWTLRNMAFQAWGLSIWVVPVYFCWSFYQSNGWVGSVLFLIIGQIVQVIIFIYSIKNAAIPYQNYPGLSEQFKSSLHAYLQKQNMRDSEVGILSGMDMGPNAFATGLFGYRQIILTEDLVKGYQDPGNPKFTLQLRDDTLEAITSHEMGHIKHYDVEKGIILGTFISSAVTIVVYYLFAARPEQYLLFAAGTSQQILLYWGQAIFNAMLLYPLTCLMMYLKRRQEYLADTFMLETNGDKNGHDFFHQMRHIAPVENHSLWHSLNMTHPPAQQREERIKSWKRSS